MIDLITATQCIGQLNKDKIDMKKGYFSQLSSSGKIPHHIKPTSTKKFYKYDEVVSALKNIKDPTRDAQREAHSKKREDRGVFDESVVPKNSLATMSDEDREKYNNSMQETVAKLENMSTGEENEGRPQAGADGQEWNVFKTMQQALNYELDRKMKESTLMYLDDYKATTEIILGPMNQGMDDFPFKLKAKFPDLTDEVIQWSMNEMNQLKVDVQNATV